MKKLFKSIKEKLFFQKSRPALFFGIAVFALFVSSHPQSSGVIDHFKVGDVVHSILGPADFVTLHGGGWVLMDGRELNETDSTDLRRFYSAQLLDGKNIPDARGVFIRGMNDTRSDGNQDPESRSVGKYQGDEFKSHSHRTNILKYWGNWSYGGNNWATASTTDDHQTDATGGVETRPKNIALYIYIKVNEQ